ncbi:MAG: hypothetical protein RIA71_06965 [Oceanicaulis sp.]
MSLYQVMSWSWLTLSLVFELELEEEAPEDVEEVEDLRVAI